MLELPVGSRMCLLSHTEECLAWSLACRKKRGVGFEVSILLECDTVLPRNLFQTFQGNVVVFSSGVDISKNNTREQLDA
jgi:hypothetical protein